MVDFHNLMYETGNSSIGFNMGFVYSDEDIRKRAQIALEILQKNDSFLLKEDVHERSVAHKLAEYLQYQFPDWNVDCEYNRKGMETKRLKGIKECKEHGKTEKVYPDIIVHERNTNNNLLVIELKKNDLRCLCDIRKLELFTSLKGEFGYTLGLFIQLGHSQMQLRWFKDGKETDRESHR